MNPAEPPMLMRDTVFTLSTGGSEDTIRKSGINGGSRAALCAGVSAAGNFDIMTSAAFATAEHIARARLGVPA